MATNQLPEKTHTIRPMSFAEILAELRQERPPFPQPPPGEPLTMAQIAERYPAQWVVLAEIDWYEDGSGEFRSAHVVSAHGDDYAGAVKQVSAAMENYAMVAHRHTNHYRVTIKRS